ncbi:MAG: hypothetical protein ACFE7S_07535 [Candidatus Hodarchaeota archaeon]
MIALTKKEILEFLKNTKNNFSRLPKEIRESLISNMIQCTTQAINEVVKKRLIKMEEVLVGAAG